MHSQLITANGKLARMFSCFKDPNVNYLGINIAKTRNIVNGP